MNTRRHFLPHPRSTASARGGFTLAELLVVIGIIGVLLAILLPVVNKVKAQGWRADSLNQINVIRSAVDAYQLTFNAYPGLFSNDEVEKVMGKQAEQIPGAGGGPLLDGQKVTMSENLVLSLVGGVRPVSTGGSSGRVFTNNPSITVVPAFGKGPSDLNPRNPKLYSPFIDNVIVQSSLRSVGSNRYSGVYQELESGQTRADDSEVPEFLDRYPNNPVPVLYYRARVGVAPERQYSYLQNSRYTINPIGPLPQIKNRSGTYVQTQHGLRNQGSASGPLRPFPITADMPAPHEAASGNDLLPYLRSPTAGAGGAYQTRGNNTYVLISPGPDRIYGTNDDLTSFGSVE